jgi:hypothetical protein
VERLIEDGRWLRTLIWLALGLFLVYLIVSGGR